MTAAAQTLVCPQCGCSGPFNKDGMRNLKDGSQKQRWLCPKCSCRFSERQETNKTGRSQRVFRKPLNITGSVTAMRQVCVLRGSKNLDPAAEPKPAVGENSHQLRNNDPEGLVAQYMAYLEREGYPQETRYPYLVKRLSRLGADLLNPETVKETIARQKIKNGSKLQYVYAYDSFAKMLKISWQPPKYSQEENLPFIPDEKELDQLIAACRSKRMAAYLQTLKETFADPGEALRIQWIDITGNTITINHPVKGHLPRKLQVSNKLLAMLNALPKTAERIFPTSYQVMENCYLRLRKKTADLQKNPRLLSIEMRTFRHWGGTTIAYHTNGNVLTVKKLLGHKCIENTMKYIGMINFKDDEYEVTTATTVDEAKQILSAGFDFVTEKNGIMIFRKPKRFSNV